MFRTALPAPKNRGRPRPAAVQAPVAQPATAPTRVPPAGRLTPDQVRELQRTAGNRAVQRALAGPPGDQEGRVQRQGGGQAAMRRLQSRVPAMSNQELISTAQTLSSQLLQPETDAQQQSVIAETLILMHRTLDQRIQNAPRDQRLLPQLEGVQWDPEDPLAGIVEGISPFQMIDWWGGFTSTRPVRRKQRRARPAQTGPAAEEPAAADTGPRPPSGVGGTLKKQIGEPFKVGPEIDTWWRNIGTGLGKAVRMLAANWINALRAGKERSARRFCLMVVAEGVASMAARIADNAIRKIVDPVSGLPMFVYDVLPEPTDARIAAALEATLKEWRAPSDRESLAIGRKRGLQMARKIVDEFDQRTSGGGVRYLLYLKFKFKADQQAIYEHVYREIKAAGVVE